MAHELKTLVMAAGLTLLVALVAVVVAGLVSSSGFWSSGGISAFTGGLSQRFVSLLLLGLPVLFVILFLVLRRKRA